MRILSLLIVLTAGFSSDARKVNKFHRYHRTGADCPIEAGVIAGQMDDKVMEEASGLAYSRNQEEIIWTINDHGDDPRVIAMSAEGQRVAIVTLEGVLNEDWEDIATTVLDGDSMILVADTGNNDFDRDPLSIFRLKEPIVRSGDMSIPRDEIEDLQVRYPDFSYDCEALAVDQTSGDIFMFTKDRENSISEVYRYPFPQSEANNPFTLEHVATLPLFWITGGDISPDGNTLALTNKQEAFSFTKPDGMPWKEFLENNPEPCILQLEEEVQRESIAVTMDGYWTTSECKKPPCPLWFYGHANTRADCPIEAGVIAGQMDDKVMEEASGLAYSRNQEEIIWTINDHGDDPRVIAMSAEGQRVAIVTLEGVLNEDWEDIATTVLDGDSIILVADTGNNEFDRDPLLIFRLKEPIVGSGNMAIPRDEIEDLQVRYPDFSYDCEALAVDQTSGDIFMFTKDRENSISEVYRYPFPQSEANNPFTLEHVATLPLFWITGGDISPDGNTLALTNKQEAFSFTKPDGMPWTEFLVNNPEPCILQLEEEVQRESIAVTMDGYWTTSECKKNPPCPLWFYAHAT